MFGASIDCIQVPIALLPIEESSKQLPSRVKVRVITDLSHATRVQVDPVSTEDWELLQVHAEVLENGGLLKQVSLVYTDQQLEFRLPTKQQNTIRVVVKEISTTSSSSSSLWPDSIDTSDSDALNETVALLASNTEVIITPMPRKTDDIVDPEAWSQALQIIPCGEDFGLRPLPNIIPGSQNLPKITPGCVLVHPNSIGWNPELFSGWAQMGQCADLGNSEQGSAMAVRLISSSEIPEGVAGTSLYLANSWWYNVSRMKIDIGLASDDSMFFPIDTPERAINYLEILSSANCPLCSRAPSFSLLHCAGRFGFC